MASWLSKGRKNFLASGRVWNISVIAWIPCELFINQSVHKMLSEANKYGNKSAGKSMQAVSNPCTGSSSLKQWKLWLLLQMLCMEVDYNDLERL